MVSALLMRKVTVPSFRSLSARGAQASDCGRVRESSKRIVRKLPQKGKPSKAGLTGNKGNPAQGGRSILNTLSLNKVKDLKFRLAQAPSQDEARMLLRSPPNMGQLEALDGTWLIVDQCHPQLTIDYHFHGCGRMWQHIKTRSPALWMGQQGQPSARVSSCMARWYTWTSCEWCQFAWRVGVRPYAGLGGTFAQLIV